MPRKKKAPLSVRHVTIDSAAVNGMALPWRPRCDSCTVAIPRAEADSLVLVNAELGSVLGATVALLAVWIVKHCWPFYACVD